LGSIPCGEKWVEDKGGVRTGSPAGGNGKRKEEGTHIPLLDRQKGSKGGKGILLGPGRTDELINSLRGIRKSKGGVQRG